MRGQLDGIRDALGTWHRPAPGARVVSLVPSLTELMFALGAGDRLVGRTGFCVHPAKAVERVPKIGGTKTVNVERIRQLAPSHLIVNVDENEKPTVDRLARFIPNIVVTHPSDPADNEAVYRLFGHVFAREREAHALCAALAAARAELAAVSWPRRTVQYLIWRDPWMAAAPETYIGAMLRTVNWHVPAAQRRYPVLELDHALAGVDLVLLSSEPYAFTESDRRELARAYPDTRFLLVDGTLCSWYGSRAPHGLSALGALARAVNGAQGPAPAREPPAEAP